MLLHIQKFPILMLAACSLMAFTPLSAQTVSHEECQKQIKELQDRLTLLEATMQELLQQRTGAPAAPAPAAAIAPLVTTPSAQQTLTAKKEPMPPELIPEIGKIGAEIGLVLNGSSNPFHLNSGQDVAGFIDLPLVDKPNWLHGKISYEIRIGLSQSKTTFSTTSNVAQIANLSVLSTLNPTGGLQNIADAVNGTGLAPFPVTAMTETRLKLLQVIPLSFKYTSTSLDRYRLRPYGILGFGTFITIHSQQALNSGVRTDANLPPSTVALVNSLYGGKAPFGGVLVAGQIAQSAELESRGLPSGHGNIDFGFHTGGGVEFRFTRSLSIGFDARFNRISGAPGSLVTYGTRLGVHF